MTLSGGRSLRVAGKVEGSGCQAIVLGQHLHVFGAETGALRGPQAAGHLQAQVRGIRNASGWFRPGDPLVQVLKTGVEIWLRERKVQGGSHFLPRLATCAGIDHDQCLGEAKGGKDEVSCLTAEMTKEIQGKGAVAAN